MDRKTQPKKSRFSFSDIILVIYIIEILKLLIASQCFQTSSNAAAAAMVAAWSSSSVVFPKGWHHRDTVMTNYNDILEHFNVMKS